MKSFVISLFTALGLSWAGYSQSLAASDSLDPATTSETTARILGTIADGTPPPEAPPKPGFVVPPAEVLSTALHDHGDRMVKIYKIKPMNLPTPPALERAVQSVVPHVKPPEVAGAYQKSGLLCMGATVFRFKDSPPRTLVRYWSEIKGECITLWSSADFALIAGGIQSFVDSAGQRYHLLMAWGDVEVDSISELQTNAGAYGAPEMPEFQEGHASYRTAGRQIDEEDLVAIQSLHDLYNSEYDRLLTAHAGRIRAQRELEADLRANPPVPKNLTLSFWRTEKTDTAVGGAAKGGVK